MIVSHLIGLLPYVIVTRLIGLLYDCHYMTQKLQLVTEYMYFFNLKYEPGQI